MQVIGIADERVAPRGAELTDEEQLSLYKSMFAYAGTYTVEAGKVIHHVDISWNEAWTGTDQVRFYELKGNTLVITSSVTNPEGTQTHYVVVWERLGGPS